MTTSYKPGQKAPKSAQYSVHGPRGGDTGHEITGVKGKTLPPTPKAGQSYRPSDPTNNKSGRG